MTKCKELVLVVFLTAFGNVALTHKDSENVRLKGEGPVPGADVRTAGSDVATPPMSCGPVQVTDGNSGRIFFPNNPGYHNNNMSCTWRVQTYHGTRIRFTLDNPYLSPGQYLYIYDGTPSNRGRRLSVLSGRVHSGYTVTASSYRAFLFFTSTSYSTSTGFNVSYYGVNRNTSAKALPPILPFPDIDFNPRQCKGVEFVTRTHVMTPGYYFPGYYLPNQNCQWRVQVTPGLGIHLYDDYFFTEADKDWAYVYYGFSTDPADKIASLTGYLEPDTTIAKIRFDQLTITFQSDCCEYYRGFRMHVDTFSLATTVPPPTEGTGGTITKSALPEESTYYNYSPDRCKLVIYIEYYYGGLISPGYFSPNWYPSHENCQWRIQVPGGIGVQFKTRYFYTEFLIDWVYIYNGHGTKVRDRIATLSGYIDQDSTVAISSSREATVTFDSDCCNSYKGFDIIFEYTNGAAPTDLPAAATTEKHAEACYGSDYNAGHSGFIYSPNYPNHYYTNLNCTYWIQTPHDTTVRLTLQSFSLGSGDYLHIYDGYTDSFIRSLSGYINYGYDVYTYVDYIQLVFTTDSFGTDSGFNIRYTGVQDSGVAYTTASPDSNCGSQMPDNYGTINSPNYPNDYESDLDCIWTIHVSSNQYTLFIINSFETESGYDYVGFYRGTPSASQGSIRQLTGFYAPGTEILVSKSDAYVVFHTDGSVTEKGFNISYSPVSANYRMKSTDEEFLPGYKDSTWWRSKSETRSGENVFGRDLWEGAKNRPAKKDQDDRDWQKP